MSIRTLQALLTSLILFSLLLSCSTAGPGGLFGRKSPHQQYQQQLTDAGLQNTALGRQWLSAAGTSLRNPLSIGIPYRETGYFAADRPAATGLAFDARRGQKLHIRLSTNPANGFTIFTDLLQPTDGDAPKLLQWADTGSTNMEFEVKKDGRYLLRLQPELLGSGSYQLSISIGPSLAFPVTSKANSRIGSFWGAGRDNGTRRHEGIDIFAPRGTALVAAADGTVTRVGENNLGGKVVWLRPNGKDYTLYYAHLDEQLISAGATVHTGDTLGLMGNTGNAKTTSPHLHFGIYTNQGAVDPLPFVDRDIKMPGRILADTMLLNRQARLKRAIALFPQPEVSNAGQLTRLQEGNVVRLVAATANWYRALLPNGTEGFVPASDVVPADAQKTITATKTTNLLAAPEATAPVIKPLNQGSAVKVLGTFNNYQLVQAQDAQGWIGK